MWEPGRRVAWKSSLDDVSIDVRFEPTDAGTRVRLEATVAEGGEDRGGSSFVAVAPAWFGAWMEQRDTAPREPRELARLGLTLRYERPAAAARWLADVFGFGSPSPLPEGDDPLSDDRYGFPWIELHAGNALARRRAARRPACPQTRRRPTSPGSSSTTSKRTSSAPAVEVPRSSSR